MRWFWKNSSSGAASERRGQDDGPGNEPQLLKLTLKENGGDLERNPPIHEDHRRSPSSNGADYSHKSRETMNCYSISEEKVTQSENLVRFRSTLRKKRFISPHRYKNKYCVQGKSHQKDETKEIAKENSQSSGLQNGSLNKTTSLQNIQSPITSSLKDFIVNKSMQNICQSPEKFEQSSKVKDLDDEAVRETVLIDGSGILISKDFRDSQSDFNGINKYKIRHILRNTEADLKGTLRVGDEILSINDVVLEQLSFDQVLKILIESKELRIAFKRPNFNRFARQEDCLQQSIRSSVSCKNLCDINEDLSKNYFTLPKKLNKLSLAKERRLTFHTIVFEKGEGQKPMGFTIVGGIDSPAQGIFVRALRPWGQALESGLLLPGDEILTINGCNCSLLTHNEALALFKGIKSGKIEMEICRRSCPNTDL